MAARSSTTCCVRGIPSTSTRTSSRCYSRGTAMPLGRTTSGRLLKNSIYCVTVGFMHTYYGKNLVKCHEFLVWLNILNRTLLGKSEMYKLNQLFHRSLKI